MNLPCRHALITGISGQDGALLAAHLLDVGMRVSGTHRPGRAPDLWRFDELGIAGHAHMQLHALDPVDAEACRRLLAEVGADAVFHLAGQTSVAESFADPLGTVAAKGLSTLNLLEAVRHETPDAHLVVATSAEMFDVTQAAPHAETAPLHPRNPYGVSSLLAHAATGSWRASFGVHASSAILFNHESEWRGDAFVTRKISRAVARVALGGSEPLVLGNLGARRDFGYAPDYVAALARLAARTEADDFVLATGQAASIREFATLAFAAIDIELDWHGDGANEIATGRGSAMVRVRVDPSLLRPIDASLLLGNAAKARRELAFAPSLDVAGIARRMVLADIARARGVKPSLQRVP